MSGSKTRRRVHILLISLIIWSALCFSASAHILLYVAVVALSTGVVILDYLLGYRNKRQNIFSYVLWVLIFNMVLFCYGFDSPYGGYSIPYHITTVLAVLMVYCLMAAHRDELFQFLFWVSCLSTVIITVYLLLGEREMLMNKFAYIMMGTSWYRLGNALHINPNTITLYYWILCIPVVYALFTKEYKLNKLVLLTVLLIQVTVVLLTGSKKGILLVFIVFLAIPFVSDKASTRAKSFLVSGMVVAVLVYLTFTNQFFFNLIGHRIVDLFNHYGISVHTIYKNDLTGTSTDLRNRLIAIAMDMFWQKPFLGWGWNAVEARGGLHLYAHNNYAELLACMGLFGFIVYYSYYAVLVMKLLLKKGTFNTRFNFVLLLCVLFIDMTSINMYGGIVTYFILAVISLNMERNDSVNDQLPARVK